ncbi:MAG TPA: HAD hydrolase family protein [Bryobacteraceae bacterium]|nr:HAD hydrolase family protein [Bryobacteraceae bacterium]
MSTLSSTEHPGPYIVVLDADAAFVRALLFDGEARRVEGFSAQLPPRAEAASDVLDELHRLVKDSGLRVSAVVGRAASEVTPEDRAAWPSFADAAWFPALPEGSGTAIGCGGIYPRFALDAGAASMVATVAEAKPENLPEGVTCAPVDEKRWLISCLVPEAGSVYEALKRELKGRVEAYLETARADDPRLARLDAAARHFRLAFEALAKAAGTPTETMGCGATLLKSPAWAQRLANALDAPLTLCTEPEPAGRGAALWALERTGAISHLSSLPASTATVFQPISDKLPMNHELLERASRIRLLLMDVDGVLTNAKLYNVPGPDGKMWETKGFDAQDGIALQWMNWYGIQTGVISGRVSPAVEERARQVKMTYVYQGHIEKIPILEEICARSGISGNEIAYIGDDLTDVVIMRRVLLSFAPANARPEVKKAAHMVLSAAGGYGAVREVCELLLQAQGKWPEILKKYEIE